MQAVATGEEEQGLARKLVAELGGMGAIVAADTDDLARLDWRQQARGAANLELLAGSLCEQPWRTAQDPSMVVVELHEYAWSTVTLEPAVARGLHAAPFRFFGSGTAGRLRFSNVLTIRASASSMVARRRS